jgi:hypothetical protein
VDKVGVGAWRLSEVALCSACMFFDRLIFYCFNNKLAWFFGGVEVALKLSTTTVGRAVDNSGMSARSPLNARLCVACMFFDQFIGLGKGVT